MGLGSHQKLLQVTSVPLKPTPREPLMTINELVFVPQRSMAGLGSYSAMSVGQVKGNGPPTKEFQRLHFIFVFMGTY